ncbi:MAG: hypothetical protein LBT82_01200 [Oscillospiraceae bacterium]|jgi:hypothetical protein|nr:hypothetical protein [Oscillospiraceae bacterium]
METNWIKSLDKILKSYNDSRLIFSVIKALIQELFDLGINSRNFFVCCGKISSLCNISEIKSKDLVGKVLKDVGSLFRFFFLLLISSPNRILF